MAGLMGAETYMITCLGDDVYADMTIENYKKAALMLTLFKECLDQAELLRYGSIAQDKTGSLLCLVLMI